MDDTSLNRHLKTKIHLEKFHLYTKRLAELEQQKAAKREEANNTAKDKTAAIDEKPTTEESSTYVQEKETAQ